MYADPDDGSRYEDIERRREARRARRSVARRDAPSVPDIGSIRRESAGRSADSYVTSSQGQAPREGARRPARRRTVSDATRQEAPVRGSRGSRRTPISAVQGIRHKLAGMSRGSMSQGSLPVPLLAAMCAGLVVLVLLMHHVLRIRVEVNGKRAYTWNGSTVERLVEAGVVSTTPGDLLAVDGSLLEKGKGNICTAKIGGKSVPADTKLHRGDVVEIGDGDDATEDADVVKETIPYGTANGSREFGAYWQGSIHLLSDGSDGVRETRTGKISGKTVSEVVEPARDAGYSIYTASPDDKVVALTFDDGPWPTTTEQVLDILEQYHAKATFFTIGNQIEGREDLLKRAVKLGCQVCTHTWDHAAGSGGGVSIVQMSKEEQIEEVQKGFAAIKRALGEEPAHIMRAPGGNFYGDAIDNLWSYLDAEIGWDVDTEDWSLPGTDVIAERIASVQSGQVVLMHDGGGDRSQTVEALRIALPQLVDAGYSFVTIDELLAYGKPQSAQEAAAGESSIADTMDETETDQTASESIDIVYDDAV